MRLIVTGFARHGKDTVCEMLCKLGNLRFTSSSYFVAERAVRPWLAARGVDYPSLDAMYADRGAHRADWYDAIADYCKDDAAKLGRELFESGMDIYCGLRNRRELLAMKKQQIVDFVVWVDASGRLPPEPDSSITIRMGDAEFVVDNHGGLDHLQGQVNLLWDHIKPSTPFHKRRLQRRLP